MRTERRWQTVVYSFVLPCLLLGLVLCLGASCKCSVDPNKIDVSPDCPNGTRAASSLAIQFNLAKIGDAGVDKQVIVAGNRKTGQDNCFQPGSKNSIQPQVQLNGQGAGNQVVSNLQDGDWKLTVQVIGGASNSIPPKDVDVSLPAGSTRTINITGGEGGSLQVTF